MTVSSKGTTWDSRIPRCLRQIGCGVESASSASFDISRHSGSLSDLRTELPDFRKVYHAPSRSNIGGVLPRGLPPPESTSETPRYPLQS